MGLSAMQARTVRCDGGCRAARTHGCNRSRPWRSKARSRRRCPRSSCRATAAQQPSHQTPLRLMRQQSSVVSGTSCRRPHLCAARRGAHGGARGDGAQASWRAGRTGRRGLSLRVSLRGERAVACLDDGTGLHRYRAGLSERSVDTVIRAGVDPAPARHYLLRTKRAMSYTLRRPIWEQFPTCELARPCRTCHRAGTLRFVRAGC